MLNSGTRRAPHGGAPAGTPPVPSERPSRWRRDPGDLVRVGLGLAVVAFATWVSRSTDRSLLEVNLFRLVNQLPRAADPPLLGTMQLGALAAVPVLAGAALLARRRLLARAIAIAGTVAWGLAKLLQVVVDERPPDQVLAHVRLHAVSVPGASFPSTHVAVAAALATVSATYLSRSARRAAWGAVAVIAVARVYVGQHFPIDVVGGAALGWAVGAGTRLWLRPPQGDTRVAALRARLESLGLGGPTLTTGAPCPSTGATSYRQVAADGTERLIKVVGHDQADADWLYRLWRLVAFRDVNDREVFVSPQHRVEHEAMVTMLAARAGVAVPATLGAAALNESESALARAWVPGTPLSEVAVPSDELLGRCWREVARLHEHHIAHGRLRADALIVGELDDVTLVELDAGRFGADDEDVRRDVAELCASTALLVGPERACRAATSVLGRAAVFAALPVLQPLTLTPTTRRALRARPDVLAGLRTEVAALEGLVAPPTELPARVATRNLLPLVVGAIAIYALLAQAGNLSRTLSATRHAQIPWMGLAVLLGALSYVAAGVALLGASSRPLAFGRTVVVQLAASFTNRLAPAGIGGMATNVSYLEHAGSTRVEAVTSVSVNSVAGFIVHVVATTVLVAVVGLGSTRIVPSVDLDWPIPVVAVVALTALGVVFWISRIPRVRGALREGFHGVAAVVRHPGRTLALFGGAAGVTACHGFALVACVQAFGIHVSMLGVLTVFLAGGAVAAVAPTPGGLGALEAALVAGLSRIGAPAAPAVAAVLALRLVTYWLPVLPGALAFRALRRRAVV